MSPKRRSRKSPGAQPLTSQRDLYISLMRQGMSNAAACRIVGVNRKTGHRWRYGRSITIRAGRVRTYPAITGPAQPVSARFLSEAELIAIADGLIRGGSIRAIAAELGRAPSTVSREIRRNRDTTTETYHPFRAQRSAAPPVGGSDRNPGSWFATLSCASSSRATWSSAGAPNRSAGRCPGCSRTGPGCVSYTRRSTRRSTLGVPANSVGPRQGSCAADGSVASGAAERASASAGSSRRW